MITGNQVLEQHHVYQRPTISISLDLEGAFDSVDRTTLFSILERKGVPLKYVNILRALYTHDHRKGARLRATISVFRYLQRCTARLPDLPISFQLCDG